MKIESQPIVFFDPDMKKKRRKKILREFKKNQIVVDPHGIAEQLMKRRGLGEAIADEPQIGKIIGEILRNARTKKR